MTREEALEVVRAVKERIEHFKECGCRFPLWTITERDEEVIDMAIEALKEWEMEVDGCCDCQHLTKEHTEEPCCKCRNAYTNKWEAECFKGGDADMTGTSPYMQQSPDSGADLISRADAIEARPEYRNEDMLDADKANYNKGWNDCTDAWRAIINAAPSAEAVQVVRCKDCLMLNTDDRRMGKVWCSWLTMFVYENDFCSNGERREP